MYVANMEKKPIIKWSKEDNEMIAKYLSRSSTTLLVLQELQDGYRADLTALNECKFLKLLQTKQCETRTKDCYYKINAHLNKKNNKNYKVFPITKDDILIEVAILKSAIQYTIEQLDEMIEFIKKYPFEQDHTVSSKYEELINRMVPMMIKVVQTIVRIQKRVLKWCYFVVLSAKGKFKNIRPMDLNSILVGICDNNKDQENYLNQLSPKYGVEIYNEKTRLDRCEVEM